MLAPLPAAFLLLAIEFIFPHAPPRPRRTCAAPGCGVGVMTGPHVMSRP
jgi:hypothetical protein